AIGRAITRKPSVFLFDEPLSNLDAALRMDMRMEIGRLRRQLGTTMIYVTHDQVEAMTLADRIVVLKDGQVMQIGAPMELYHEPANRFVAGFLGAPSMNFLNVDVLDLDGEAATVGNQSLEPIRVATRRRSFRKDGKAILGIRPQYLRAAQPGEGMLHGIVAHTERLGSETVVDLTLRDDHELIAAFDEDKIFEPGDALELTFDTALAHLFPDEGELQTP
ncbi:MAG: TOBE domain-containing protein, partial [Mesorhizobium sp.]